MTHKDGGRAPNAVFPAIGWHCNRRVVDAKAPRQTISPVADAGGQHNSIYLAASMERNQVWPPMLFSDLVQDSDLPATINEAIAELLSIKTTSNEFQSGPVNPILHSYVTAELERLMTLNLNQTTVPESQPLLDLLRSTALRLNPW